ncbi:MAG: hypothetical protein A4E52_01424 [Pelotomaculum sp. PtaB.Bin013]|nr:MAG: hypothetical protein A4E52_01424 [Pelotomaculum sp. PtaB.Bin013]
MRGSTLLLVGPGTSALYSCMAATFKDGMSARMSTMVPMPPRKWVKLRQNRIPCGRISTLGITEAPVVVKPDIVSKKAS